MKPVVVTKTSRVDAGLVHRLAQPGVSTADEALGRVGLVKPWRRPLWAGAQVADTEPLAGVLGLDLCKNARAAREGWPRLHRVEERGLTFG